MNIKLARWQYAALITLAFVVHREAMVGVPDSAYGAAQFYGSAALLDWFLVRSACHFLKGHLCDDMEILCYISVAANFVGWVSYYFSFDTTPYYLAFMKAYSVIQAIRLLLVDDDGTISLRGIVVWRPFARRA